MNAQLQEKHYHLMQVYDAESKLKWEYLSQVEKLSNENKELREQVNFKIFPFKLNNSNSLFFSLKVKALTRQQYFIKQKSIDDNESIDLKRIKKVIFFKYF